MSMSPLGLTYFSQRYCTISIFYKRTAIIKQLSPLLLIASVWTPNYSIKYLAVGILPLQQARIKGVDPLFSKNPL